MSTQIWSAPTGYHEPANTLPSISGGSGPVDYSQQYLALSHTLLRLASSLSLTSGGGGGGGQGSTPVNLFADGERSIQHCVNQSYLLVSSWPSSSTLDDFTAVSSYVSNMDAQLYDGIIRGSSRGGGSEALDPLSPLGRAHINSLLTVGIPIVDANEQVNSMMLEPIVSAVADGQATSFVIDLGLALRSIKLQAARAFKAELDRLSRLAQLAQQMDALLVNKSFLAQLLSRWRNLDFVSIRRATEWASIGTRLVDTVFVHFPTQLYASSKAAPMSPSVSLANWFKQVYRQCADVAETESHNVARHNAGVFLMIWIRAITLLQEDLNRADATPFGDGCQALGLFCQECMCHIVQTRLRELYTNALQ